MEIRTYNLNRKQKKLLLEFGKLADRMNLSPNEAWQTASHYVVFMKDLHEKGLHKMEEKGYIEKTK